MADEGAKKAPLAAEPAADAAKDLETRVSSALPPSQQQQASTPEDPPQAAADVASSIVPDNSSDDNSNHGILIQLGFVCCFILLVVFSSTHLLIWTKYNNICYLLVFDLEVLSVTGFCCYLHIIWTMFKNYIIV